LLGVATAANCSRAADDPRSLIMPSRSNVPEPSSALALAKLLASWSA
jgi:hypothetical protein